MRNERKTKSQPLNITLHLKNIMTDTIEAPVKKAIAAVGIQPFFVDRTKLRTELSQFELRLNQLEGLRALWDSFVPKHKIRSLEDLKLVVADPCQRFISFHPDLFKSEEEPKGTLGKLVAKSAVETAARKATYPDGFIEVVTKSNLVKAVNWKYIDFNTGVATLSEEFYRRQINKSVFYTITPAQKKRLLIAENLLSIIGSVDQVLQDELQEAGIENRYSDEIENKAHIGPLPVPLRYEFIGANKTVKINPAWVVEGNKSTFYGLSTGSSNDVFKLGVINGMPTLFAEGDRKTGDALVFEGKYKFQNARLVWA